MPLVRIEIIKGKEFEYKKALLDAVHVELVSRAYERAKGKNLRRNNKRITGKT